MSWMNQLFKTYENSIEKGQSNSQLMPIAHMNANAQVEITIDQCGEFKSATSVDKEDSVTLIPVSEASAARTAGIVPHPLCDTLSYIAGDFSIHCGDEKQKKDSEKKFNEYIENLKKWVESEHSHEKVVAVYKYVLKKEIISDLANSGLIELKENGVFDNKKINGQPYEKVLVRFRILSDEIGSDKTWEDNTLIQAYKEYYLSIQNGRKDICYFSGENSTISESHPKGILAYNYGSKIISANDSRGYTYRGRFETSEQAYALSYEASQKIHSALTWLAKNQGESIGSKSKRTFICWSPENKKVPGVLDELGLEEDEEAPNIGVNYGKKLRKTFQGYMNQFDETDSVVVIGLDAATTGRLSITYYNELMASDFLDRIIYWGETCNWFFTKFNSQKKPYTVVETPTLKRIAECAFGREKGAFIEIDDKVLKEQTQRLVKCMIEKQPMPFDIVHALTARASTRTAYSRGNWERVLSTACAVINKYYCEKNSKEKGEKYIMELNQENTDRSYLFGRLLAVCENVERAAYDRGEEREPNAVRLQSVYVSRPMKTFKVLHEALNPYFQKLNPGLRKYYKNLIGDILSLFRDEDEKKLNLELGEIYLLGYYLQRADLYKKKNNEKESDDEN